ncbi:basic endochitinase-like [Impatiens glandulifera]|uniref:basic endochitinase-like n=1 Tax=Impatiens glandulifera TaxID=253017 RepID=UPI001FB07A14|nr:basic endochitinase-like [Impatiens glandulifera]
MKNSKPLPFLLLSLLAIAAAAAAATCCLAEQCGREAGGPNCQSQCGGTPTPGPGPVGDIATLITESMFNNILKHRNEGSCPGKGFYTYNAFVGAARSFNGFATTGDTNTRKKEIAAFLAQTSHETTGGWASAPDGPYAWGYCFLREQGNPPDYCSPSAQWPCAPGRKYFGRGPIQISYNFNYGPAGRAIGVDLLNNPDLVATDPTISFKTALWFWMTPQSPKPSCHDVITRRWSPSGADQAAGRVPGYGIITNIINGGVECGHGSDSRVQDRIGFYKRYCSILGVNPGDNLDCGNQRSFGNILNLVETM